MNNKEKEQLRTEVGKQLQQILKETKLKQVELAKVLRVKQPEVSHLMNGNFKRFRIDKMFELLRRLNKKVKIVISEKKGA